MDTTFLEFLVFFAAAAMVLGGAIGVITLKNPVHAALGLVMTLFGIAVQFVAQEAHFLAAVQVIVYAGAIVVLFLFVIMLLGVDNAMDLSIEPIKVQRPLAAIMGLGLVSLITAAIVKADSSDVLPGAVGTGIDSATGRAPVGADGSLGELDLFSGAGAHDSNIRQLAENLYGDHVFAFQLTSVLLIVAVAGTVVLTRKWPKADADHSNTSGSDA